MSLRLRNQLDEAEKADYEELNFFGLLTGNVSAEDSWTLSEIKVELDGVVVKRAATDLGRLDVVIDDPPCEVEKVLVCSS